MELLLPLQKAFHQKKFILLLLIISIDEVFHFGVAAKNKSETIINFDPTHSGDVTALHDRTALLNCRVYNINNSSTVSWIRHRDIHLLTVGRYTYTSDQRFRSRHEDDTDDWLLKINFAQLKDSGIYECQVSTTPPMSHFVHLKVVKPLTYVLGDPDIHIDRGSKINLTCVVEYSPQPPEYIYWNHNDKVNTKLRCNLAAKIHILRRVQEISLLFFSH